MALSLEAVNRLLRAPRPADRAEVVEVLQQWIDSNELVAAPTAAPDEAAIAAAEFSCQPLCATLRSLLGARQDGTGGGGGGPPQDAALWSVLRALGVLSRSRAHRVAIGKAAMADATRALSLPAASFSAAPPDALAVLGAASSLVLNLCHEPANVIGLVYDHAVVPRLLALLSVGDVDDGTVAATALGALQCICHSPAGRASAGKHDAPIALAPLLDVTNAYGRSERHARARRRARRNSGGEDAAAVASVRGNAARAAPPQGGPAPPPPPPPPPPLSAEPPPPEGGSTAGEGGTATADTVVRRAVDTCHNLSSDIDQVLGLLAAGVVPHLVALLASGLPGVCASAAGTLQNMSRTDEGRASIVSSGALMPLADLLMCSEMDAQVAATGALYNVLAPKMGSGNDKAALGRLLSDSIALGALHDVVGDYAGPARGDGAVGEDAVVDLEDA